METNKIQEMIEIYETQLNRINEAIETAYKKGDLIEAQRLSETRDEIIQSLFELRMSAADIVAEPMGDMNILINNLTSDTLKVTGLEECDEPDEYVRINIYGNSNCTCGKTGKVLVEQRIVNTKNINRTIKELNRKIAKGIYEDYTIRYISDEGDGFYEQD